MDGLPPLLSSDEGIWHPMTVEQHNAYIKYKQGFALRQDVGGVEMHQVDSYFFWTVRGVEHINLPSDRTEGEWKWRKINNMLM